jgi:ABC-type amino acid transport substrate-binding protein
MSAVLLVLIFALRNDLAIMLAVCAGVALVIIILALYVINVGRAAVIYDPQSSTLRVIGFQERHIDLNKVARLETIPMKSGHTQSRSLAFTDIEGDVVAIVPTYFTSKQGILIAAGNEAIKGLDDLAGKVVATQQGSSGPAILAEYAPEAIVQEEIDDETARQDVEVGRADAYVTDYTLILGSIVRNPGKYAVAGIFGEDDNYGIGLPKDSDGVAFVNAFLKQIEEKKAEIAAIREKQRRFNSDREFVEALARQNRRVYPGELVFIFDE